MECIRCLIFSFEKQSFFQSKDHMHVILNVVKNLPYGRSFDYAQDDK